MPRGRHKSAITPLDAAALDRLALRYAERYATTRAKLRAYLGRKLRERGWDGEGEPGVEGLVERFAALGYVDDRGFALAKASALGRRGFGPRRVGVALRAAGIEEADGAEAQSHARDNAWTAAVRFAERKRIGPFALQRAEREQREKAIGAMMRAGHSLDFARRLVNAAPGEVPEQES